MGALWLASLPDQSVSITQHEATTLEGNRASGTCPARKPARRSPPLLSGPLPAGETGRLYIVTDRQTHWLPFDQVRDDVLHLLSGPQNTGRPPGTAARGFHHRRDSAGYPAARPPAAVLLNLCIGTSTTLPYRIPIQESTTIPRRTPIQRIHHHPVSYPHFKNRPPPSEAPPHDHRNLPRRNHPRHPPPKLVAAKRLNVLTFDDHEINPASHVTPSSVPGSQARPPSPPPLLQESPGAFSRCVHRSW